VNTKSWLILAAIAAFVLWKQSASNAVASIGSAGNPTPVAAPAGSGVASAGNSNVSTIANLPSVGNLLPILTFPINRNQS
jgi:hypothetical protein